MENFGKYIIEKQIGEGGTALVYLAKDSKLNRNVALKIMSNQQFSTMIDFKKLFIDEARRTANLNHPNIIQIYEVEKIDDNIYIAMEYLAGGTLKSRMTEQQDFNPIKVLTDIARALDYAYTEAATIHRDIKPANIIFRQHTNGSLDAVLTDFGISKTEGIDSDFTSFDIKVGTPRYMSPEQLLGGSVDQRSDLYSLGIVFFEMLVGKKPFHQQNTVTIIGNSTTNNAPKLPPEFKEYQSLLDKLIAPHPDNRFKTAQELLSAIGDIKKTSHNKPIKFLVRSFLSITIITGGYFTYLFFKKDIIKQQESNLVVEPPLLSKNSSPKDLLPIAPSLQKAQEQTNENLEKPIPLSLTTAQDKVKEEISAGLIVTHKKESKRKELERRLNEVELLIKNKQLKQAENLARKVLETQKIPEDIYKETKKILSRIETIKKAQITLKALASIKITSNKTQSKINNDNIDTQPKISVTLATKVYLHCLYQSPPPEDKKMMRIFPSPKAFLSYDWSLKKYIKYEKRKKISLSIGEGQTGTAQIHCFATASAIEKKYNSLFHPDSNGLPYTKAHTTLNEIERSIHQFTEGIYALESFSIKFSK